MEEGTISGVGGLADLPHELQQIVIQHVCIPAHSFADICPQDIASCARLCKYWASIIRHAVWSILAHRAQLHCRVFWPVTPPPHQEASFHSNIVKHCVNMQKLGRNQSPSEPGQQETHIGLHLSGPLQSGKSTLVGKFVQNKFFEQYDPTIEDSYAVSCTFVKNQQILLKLLDSTGNEELLQLWQDSFTPRNAHCLFLIVAADDMYSHPENFKKWALRVKEKKPVSSPVVLIISKADLANKTVIEEDVRTSRAALRDLGIECVTVVSSKKEQMGCAIDSLFGLGVSLAFQYNKEAILRSQPGYVAEAEEEHQLAVEWANIPPARSPSPHLNFTF